jgi:hypothetical protein
VDALGTVQRGWRIPRPLCKTVMARNDVQSKKISCRNDRNRFCGGRAFVGRDH